MGESRGVTALGRYDYDCGDCGRRIFDRTDIDEWQAQHTPDCPMLVCMRADPLGSRA